MSDCVARSTTLRGAPLSAASWMPVSKNNPEIVIVRSSASSSGVMAVPQNSPWIIHF